MVPLSFIINNICMFNKREVVTDLKKFILKILKKKLILGRSCDLDLSWIEIIGPIYQHGPYASKDLRNGVYTQGNSLYSLTDCLFKMECKDSRKMCSQ